MHLAVFGHHPSLSHGATVPTAARIAFDAIVKEQT
jgi:hypothetical protein